MGRKSFFFFEREFFTCLCRSGGHVTLKKAFRRIGVYGFLSAERSVCDTMLTGSDWEAVIDLDLNHRIARKNTNIPTD